MNAEIEQPEEAEPHRTSAEKHTEKLERISTAMDPKIHGMIAAWRRKAPNAPASIAPPPIETAADPVTVRLDWYLPPRHRYDTFETFVSVTASQRAALDATRKWVDMAKAGRGGSLALVGGVGTGKSHLLYAAVRALNEAGVHCAGYGWWDLAEIRRAAKFDDDEARAKWNRFLAADAFALDEIRPTSGSDFDTTELSQLMTRAYRECQGVLITSNHAGDNLSRIVGLAATSRLSTVTIMGPDMREIHNRRKYLG